MRITETTTGRELVRELNEATKEYRLSKTTYEARRPANNIGGTRELDLLTTSHKKAEARWDAAVRAVQKFDAAREEEEPIALAFTPPR